MKNNNLLLTKARPTKKTTKKIFSAVREKNRNIVITSLQQVLTSFQKKKKKISPISNTFFIEEKANTLIYVPKTKISSQKTSINLGDIYVGNYSWKRGY